MGMNTSPNATAQQFLSTPTEDFNDLFNRRFQERVDSVLNRPQDIQRAIEVQQARAQNAEMLQRAQPQQIPQQIPQVRLPQQYSQEVQQSPLFRGASNAVEFAQRLLQQTQPNLFGNMSMVYPAYPLQPTGQQYNWAAAPTPNLQVPQAQQYKWAPQTTPSFATPQATSPAPWTEFMASKPIPAEDILGYQNTQVAPRPQIVGPNLFDPTGA